MIPPERLRQVIAAVREGRISSGEAELYLQSTYQLSYSAAEEQVRTQNQAADLSKKTQVALLAAVSLICLVVVAAFLLYANGGASGLVVLNIGPSANASMTNGTFAITQNISGLNVTGLLVGDGNATLTFTTDNASYLVAFLQSDTGDPSTDQDYYSPGDNVSVLHAPANASYYLEQDNALTPVVLPFSAPASNSTLLIVANVSGNLTTYHVPIVIGFGLRTSPFASVCIDTCVMPASTGVLSVQTTGSASVVLTSVDATGAGVVQPPVLITPFPSITINATTTIDLSTYFVSPDGATLVYSAGSNDDVQATINGSDLVLTPLQDGTGPVYVYASDLQNLVPTSFIVTVSGLQASSNESVSANTSGSTNASVSGVIVSADNSTDNSTNVSIVTNGTNVSVTSNVNSNSSLPPLNCNEPNPNLRPPECLLENGTNYFPSEVIDWDNLDGTHVATFTVIGNLLITGDVVTNDTTGSPGPRDFRIGYPDIDGNIIDTVWVDAQGNLHLLGNITEEVSNIQPPPGSYSILTRRGIYVAYIDIATGNLYLRGNIVPYRRSI